LQWYFGNLALQRIRGEKPFSAKFKEGLTKIKRSGREPAVNRQRSRTTAGVEGFLPSADPLLAKIVTTSSDGSGAVYDLDGPEPVGTDLLVTTQRYRGNFREYTELGAWRHGQSRSATEQASDDFFWFSRSSCTAIGSLHFDTDTFQQQGDNSTGGATGPRINGSTVRRQHVT
jgi:hypothetical protein